MGIYSTGPEDAERHQNSDVVITLVSTNLSHVVGWLA